MSTTYPIAPASFDRGVVGSPRWHRAGSTLTVPWIVLDADALRNGAIDRLIATAVFSRRPGARCGPLDHPRCRRGARRLARVDPWMSTWPPAAASTPTAPRRPSMCAPSTYDTMRAVFRAAMANDCKIVLFELARSEMAYTQQRPGEYASNVLAAAIKEGYTGPVFIQGDHYQISAKKWATDPEGELDALQAI